MIRFARHARRVVVLVGLALIGTSATTAWAQTPAQTLARFQAAGPNQVQVLNQTGFTFFVPVGVRNAPIVTWGNGTNANPNNYATLLRNFASHGLLVVASTSGQTGNGNAMITGITRAQVMSTSQLVCTAGHSQGGAGAVNAARDPRVDCAMPIQPDTTFTAQANGQTLNGKTSLILCGTADNLAPCGATNARRNGNGLFNQSAGPVILVSEQGSSHFEPARGNAYVGVATAFMVANLRNDPAARALFLGANPGILQPANFVQERFKATGR